LIAAEIPSSRPEAAFVLLLLQSLFWGIAGISALPFAIAGEVFMIGLGAASMLLALATLLAAIGVLWRRRSSRRLVVILEWICLVGSAIHLAVPIGANHGLVSVMVNLGLPAVVILLLRKPKDLFS
jgi:hypothetical protein